jgi:hypothetical protein
MARAAAVRKPQKKKVPPKARVKVKPLKLETRKLSVDRRRGGKVSVLVQKKPLVPVAVTPAAPPARPIKLTGTPQEVSRAFFETHNLQPLSAALPPLVATEEFLNRAKGEGFDRVFVFPPVKVQRAALDVMLWQLLRAPSSALEPSQQYSAPWIFDVRELATGDAHGRPEGPYALAIADGQYPEDTRDRKSAQLEARFQALGQSSLTVFEYVVLQRLFAEEFQDHRFDQNGEAHGHPSGWQWLLDTRSSKGSLHAFWNPAKRRVEVGAVPPANFNTRRGAHPTLVKPL